jgi:predicted ribosome quality control (RQC) complex YloA/Tae2 family protein
MLAYLASLDVSLLTAGSKNEVEEIRQELLAVGLLKEQGKRKSKGSLPKSQPLHLRLPSGTEIYIGKNNKQNDYVTFSLGASRDLWLHTKDIPGSHLIIKGGMPSDEHDLALALQLAAYFSKARHGSNVPVDCVEKRYVKKPAGSKPGFVIFTNQQTYYINPDEELLAPYLKKLEI